MKLKITKSEPAPQPASEDRGTGFTIHKANGVTQSNVRELDDAFEDFYFLNEDQETNKDKQVLRPPYDPAKLIQITQENNALGQLVSAMEVNIDGTGYEFVRRDGAPVDDDDPEQIRLEDFFSEVWPRVSFRTVRRTIRRDAEACGYAFLEVARNVAQEPVFLRPVPSPQMRLVKLDEPVEVDIEIMRNGKRESVRMMKRERRFVQIVGNKLVYFREYGASRHLNKKTGEWESEDKPVEIEDRATEIIYFTIHKDAQTPYGVPRWINNLPSALGSRKAEEHNLDFFDAGGMPPAMIFVSGGKPSQKAEEALRMFLGPQANKHRAVVADIHATGKIDGTGNVKVQVERFGSERQQDSMFENYDEKCEARCRSSFRLPPIFVGKSQDYSFATAFASYVVAEAQVFRPEREEFDEVMNNTLVRELSDEYEMRSLPMTVRDIEHQLKGLEFADGKIDKADFMKAVNEVTGLELPTEDLPDDPAPPNPNPPPPPGTEEPPGQMDTSNVVPIRQPESTPVQRRAKSWDSIAVARLADDICKRLSKSEPLDELAEIVKCLTVEQRQVLDASVAMRMMPGIGHDVEGTVEVMGATLDALGCR